MIHNADLNRIYGYGAQLDAWAAKISRQLGKDVPAYQQELEKNRLDELAHAEILAKLFKPMRLDETYSMGIGYGALTPDPKWNVTMLNFVERRSEVQFRMAWRMTRNADLLSIAADEARHIKLGRQIIKELGVTPDMIEQVRAWVEHSDSTCGSVTPDQLKNLNYKVAEELIWLCN